METQEKLKITPDISKCIGDVKFSIKNATLYYLPASNEQTSRNEEECHHYELWFKLLLFLSDRGFSVTGDKKVHKCIRNTRKRGKKKNGLEFKTHIYPNGFEFEFFQNVTKPENCNGGEYDFNKYYKMPYMLKLSLRNELQRMADFANQFVKVDTIYNPKGAIDSILKYYRERSFTRNNINSIEELDSMMSQYDLNHNNRDKNKNAIKNGDIKYFYDLYTKRLSRGQVFHNCNNMWWVILNDTTYTNIVMWDLFDYSPSLPKRKRLTKEQKIQRLHTELKNHESKSQYERCIVLRDLINGHKLYHIWSIKRHLYTCLDKK